MFFSVNPNLCVCGGGMVPGIDMRLGPVTKLKKKNKTTLKKFDDDVMSADYDVIIIFPIYGQFSAIRKEKSGCIVCKIYIFINNNPLLYKNWKQN